MPNKQQFQIEPQKVSGISASEVAEYAAVSGDDNPIHAAPDLAEAAGLNGVPVQGMFVMGIVSKYVEAWERCLRLENLQMRFISPAFIDTELSISARVVSLSDKKDRAVLRISVMQQDRLVCIGEADSMLKTP